MKVRNFFVSNSSSSSFIIVGWDVTNQIEMDELWKCIDEDTNFYIAGVDGITSFGVKLTSDFVDNGIEEYNINKIQKLSDEAIMKLEKFRKLKELVGDTQPKIYVYADTND